MLLFAFRVVDLGVQQSSLAKHVGNLVTLFQPKQSLCPNIYLNHSLSCLEMLGEERRGEEELQISVCI